MEAFFISTLVVAIGEIGDKTQLLALVLATRFKRPVPIVLGILVATLCNHTAAGLLGEWVRSMLDPALLRWALGISFLAVAAWALVPDRLEDDKHAQAGRWGVFATTAIAFFLAEIGDKTQVATIMLAAKYHALVLVVAGTTLGMLIADVPAVFVGTVAAARLPMKAVRIVAALLFGALGVAAIAGFSL